MRRMAAWGVAAALAAGLGVAAAAEPADESGKPPARRGLLAGLFADKPKDKGQSAAKGAAEAAPAPRPSGAAAVAEQQRHMNAVLRRMQVCQRLRQIAEQTGNDELRRRADELDARAWEVYRLRTAHLPAAETSFVAAPEGPRGKEGVTDTSAKGGRP